MNLVIDIGNSLVKWAIFKKEELLDRQQVSHDILMEELVFIKEKYPKIKRCILSSVGNLETKQIDYLKRTYTTITLDSTIRLPFTNLYTTPNTLGVDRIALVSASVLHFPYNNVLIIDAGTCITFDFITSDNSYRGGAISPGIQMRYKALNTFTTNLPLLKMEYPQNLTGNSTKNSIHSGVIYGVIVEINGIIAAYQEEYIDLTVILTGGDAKFLSKQLKSSIFANSNFLLEGLNYILQFNSD